MPQISIYIPTYEPNPHHLTEALESLKNQTFTDWEAIIHDDCSNTDVKAMIESFLKDPRLTFHRSDKRLGIGGNWNACLQFGSAPFVQYLFQDDLWEPACLEKSVAALSDSSIGFVATNHRYIFENDQAKLYDEVQKLRDELAPEKHAHEEFLRTWIGRGLHPNLIGEPSFVMIRRTVLKKTGFFREDMPQSLDAEMWLRLLLHHDFFFIAEKLGSFRVHGKGASAQNQEAGAGLFDRIRMFDVLLKHLPRGEMRNRAKRNLEQSLGRMIGKFFKRKEKGGKVKKEGAGSLVSFCIRHPALCIKAMMDFLTSA